MQNLQILSQNLFNHCMGDATASLRANDRGLWLNNLRFVQKNKETSAFMFIFDEESNGGLENAVARTVPEIQTNDMKFNFFTITVGKSPRGAKYLWEYIRPKICAEEWRGQVHSM